MTDTRHTGCPEGDIDPITLEVIDNRFDEAVRNMQHVMFRTGYSTIIRDSKDGSAGICLADGRVIGQAFRLPLHCGVFPPTIESVLESFDVSEIGDGDTFVMNDPYRCGANHSPDMLVATPVFYDGELEAFCTTIAHKPDLGGLVPGTSSPDAREIYHEGLLLPPVKYRRGGEIDRDVENIIRNNSRTPEVTVGDVRGQVGSTSVGVEKVRSMLDEYGPETVRGASESILRSTTDRVADDIRDWDGSVRVEGVLDNPSGEGSTELRLEVSTAAGEGSLTFDFTGTASQTRGPSNMQPHVVKSACYYGLVGVLDSTLPLNSGVAAVCSFVLPERSVVNPARPAPCNNYSKGMCVVVHMALRALSSFAPERAVAETGGKMSIAIGSRSDSTGTSTDGSDESGSSDDFVHYEIIGSGYGGHATGDGASCMASSYESNAEFASIEILETEFDDRVSEFSIRTDSAGAGRHRGGVGFLREYEILAPLRFTYRGSNHDAESLGVEGGGSSGAASATRITADGEAIPLETIDSVAVDPGDRVRIVRPGGAGFGEPSDRSSAAVLEDVLDGFVSVEAARDEYGVVVVDGPDGPTIDGDGTREQREG